MNAKVIYKSTVEGNFIAKIKNHTKVKMNIGCYLLNV